MKKLLKNQRGFSLVEVIIAIAIFGIVTVVFLQAYTSGLVMTIRANKREEAVVQSVTLIDTQLSDITDNTVGDSTVGDSTVSNVGVKIYYNGSAIADPNFTGAYEIEVESDIDDYKGITGQKVRLKGFKLR